MVGAVHSIIAAGCSWLIVPVLLVERRMLHQCCLEFSVCIVLLPKLVATATPLRLWTCTPACAPLQV